MKMKELISELREVLGEDYVVESKIVEKPNGVRLQGISIIRKGDNISPIIYINDNMTAQDVVDIYNNNKGDVIMNTDVNDIMSRNYILENVIPVLYNREACKNILDSIVTISHADLEIAFRVVVNNDIDNVASYLIKTDMLSHVDLTEQELYDASVANIQGKGKVCDIMSMLFDMGANAEELPDGANDPMVVITNDNKRYASSMIFDKAVRDKLEKIFGEYYILPSSIHELIAVSKEHDVSELVDMVRGINATQVAPADFLSDNVYIYTDELEVA